MQGCFGLVAHTHSLTRLLIHLLTHLLTLSLLVSARFFSRNLGKKILDMDLYLMNPYWRSVNVTWIEPEPQ